MPNISANDVLLIKKQLALELTLIKKLSHYANTCKDPQLKAKYEQISAKHQGHFAKLLNLLG